MSNFEKFLKNIQDVINNARFELHLSFQEIACGLAQKLTDLLRILRLNG